MLLHDESLISSRRGLNPRPFGLRIVTLAATPLGQSAGRDYPFTKPARGSQGSPKQTSLDRQLVGQVAGGRARPGRDCVFLPRSNFRAASRQKEYFQVESSRKNGERRKEKEERRKKEERDRKGKEGKTKRDRKGSERKTGKGRRR